MKVLHFTTESCQNSSYLMCVAGYMEVDLIRTTGLGRRDRSRDHVVG